MNNPLLRLSIVVPVYNVAPYLPTCLDSLSAQTLPPDEIVVVDDGSTDDCPRILADYARRMPNLRVIRQENQGLSAARNAGIDAARGKWLAFVDSDDSVANDMYQRLVEMAEAGNLDMALCNATYHFEGRQPDFPVYANARPSTVMRGAEWLRYRLESGRLLHMVWMHLYRRDFIERNQFRFVPKLVHEDVIWTTRALLAAERVQFTPAPLYTYRIPIRKSTGAALTQKLERLVESSVYNARILVDIANAEEARDRGLAALVRWQAVDGAFSVFHKIEKFPEREQRIRHREQLRDSGFFRFLWHNAADLSQHRRVLRAYLRSWWPR